MKEFYDDVRDKKALVPSSRHRVCGSKSKKCSLPSDNLTDAQKCKLNGPCETYAINKPCDWATFKAMPHDIAQAWLDYVQNRFLVSLNAIAVALWDGQVSRVTVSVYLRKNGFKTIDGMHSNSKKIMALQAWAAGDVKEEPVPVMEEVEQEPVMEFHKYPSPPEAMLVTERITIEIAGDWEAIRVALDQRFVGKKVSLTVQADICCTQGGDAGG